MARGRREDAGSDRNDRHQRASRDKPSADVEIGAVVRARKLRFREVPDTEVRFPGRGERETDSHTERENLPDEVEPGVTYRDVRVRWNAGARIVDPESTRRPDEDADRGEDGD